jgi:hypothetical protein
VDTTIWHYRASPLRLHDQAKHDIHLEKEKKVKKKKHIIPSRSSCTATSEPEEEAALTLSPLDHELIV